MRNKLITVIVIIIIIVGVVWALADKNKSTPPSATSNSSSSESSSTATQAVATNKVDIANMAFSPADITITKGTTVTWTNQDSIAHTVTENDGKNGPSAPPLDQGQSYSFTFNQTGTFHYHCSIHPEMTGSVTVTE